MAKYTLLELVQSILNSLDGDEVNSYSDTVESRQIAGFIKDTYNDIVSQLSLPEHFSLFELIASGDSSKPTIMTLPTNCTKLEWIKYNNKLSTDPSALYKNVKPLPMDEFLDRMYLLDTDDTNVETFTHSLNSGDPIDFFCYNNKFPEYYTTPDDNTLIFDSYYSDLDSTLQKSKTIAYGQLSPTFTMSDSFTPDLDEKQFSLLLNEAKAQAFAEAKQSQNIIAERRARRGWISQQKYKQGIDLKDDMDRLPNYGKRW